MLHSNNFLPTITRNIASVLVLMIAAVVFWFVHPYVSKAGIFSGFASMRLEKESTAPVRKNARIAVGPATSALLHRIEKEGLDPIPVSKIVREPFTVSGTIVTLDTDNISVFEYVNVNAVVRDVRAFQESTHTASRTGTLKITLYQSDNLFVFYMGNNTKIINALQTILGAPITNSST